MPSIENKMITIPVDEYEQLVKLNMELGAKDRHINDLKKDNSILTSRLTQFANQLKKNEEEIEEEIRKGKKANNINEVNNEYMKKLNFKEARIIFLLKTNMIEAKANYRFQYPENQICDICEKQEETTQHLLDCEGYKEIRRNIRIKSTPMETIKENNMNSLANVISKILEKRKELMEVKKNAPTEENASKTSTAPLQSVALRTEDSDNDR